MGLVKLAPAYQDYLWGGTRLKEEYHKTTDLAIVAESWELSAHPAGLSKVVSKEEELDFAQYLAKQGKEKIGKKAEQYEKFPLLIKFIDAKGQLSLQVHPQDAYAKVHDNDYGKTELWYIMEAAPDAFLYIGFNRAITKDEVRARIADGTLTEVLRKVPVQKGESYLIEAGTVHAINAGIMVCEIQENSNATYRVYDYNRRGADGKLRPLHIEKALDVADLSEAVVNGKPDGTLYTEDGYKWQLLKSCNYFTVFKADIQKEMTVSTDSKSFTSILCLSGNGTASYDDTIIPFRKGDSLYADAEKGTIVIKGTCEVIVTKL